MAVFRIVTFLIHAIVQAIASLLVAVFTRLVPALVFFGALAALLVAVCATCGMGSFAVWRRRRRE